MNMAKLLLVENNPLLVKLLPLQLTRRGWQIVATVQTGEDAILQARNTRPDLVLMDIDLDGDMDGITAAASIKNDFGIPILFTTSHNDPQATSRIQKSVGAALCLLKPFTEKEIALAIEFALYRHAAETERAKLESQLRALGSNPGTQ